jgi:lipoprotein NlpD
MQRAAAGAPAPTTTVASAAPSAASAMPSAPPVVASTPTTSAPAASAPPATTASPAASTPSAPSAAPTPAPPAESKGSTQAPDEDDDKLGWVWPASGKLVTGFSDTANLKGIDIAGKAGQPVVASAAGKVVYAGSGLRGYGKLIIIKHNKSYLSAYAHNKEILVKEGQQVTRGQKIAEMGNTDADQNKLHFEIRRLGKPMDPLKFLPPA